MQNKPPKEIAEDVVRTAVALVSMTRKDVVRILRKRIKGTGYAFPTSIQLWEAYHALTASGEISANPSFEKAIRIKDVRTDSGVAPITVLTKPHPCPGRCVYCPNEERMPKSYLSKEPAAARALSLAFDPAEQVTQRIHALARNGHDAHKIELIIKGGTWSSYPKDYREWFIAQCFAAANSAGAEEELPVGGGNELSLEVVQEENETADYRIIGLTIETRPDWITAEEVIHLRKLGCTRVELGLQILNDRVLGLTKRGTTVADAVRAIALLKTAGFKVDAHILPGQPGSSPEEDIQSFELLFSDPRFRPDMVKIYPCVVLPNTELAEWSEQGRFQPLEGDKLRELLIRLQLLVPRYCRVPRMIRDFPTTDILQGNKEANMRESVESEMRRRGTPCQCLRCREVAHVSGDHQTEQTRLFEERYENAGGTEVFLSIENNDRTAVFGFCRLRLPGAPTSPDQEKILSAFPAIRDSAFIRELHTYGTALNLNEADPNASQHKGYGRLLMQHAEKIAQTDGYKKMAVISGIGVREYYRFLGYSEADTYMIKSLET